MCCATVQWVGGSAWRSTLLAEVFCLGHFLEVLLTSKYIFFSESKHLSCVSKDIIMTPIAFIQVNTSLPSFKSSVTQVVWNIFPKEKHSISQETLQKYHRLRHYHVSAFPVSSSPFSPTRRSPFHLLHFWNPHSMLILFLLLSLYFSLTFQCYSTRIVFSSPGRLSTCPMYLSHIHGFIRLPLSLLLTHKNMLVNFFIWKKSHP